MYKLYLSFNLFKSTVCFHFKGVLKIHKHTTHLPQPVLPLSNRQYPISTPPPQHYFNTPIHTTIIWYSLILCWTRFKHEISDFLVQIIPPLGGNRCQFPYICWSNLLLFSDSLFPLWWNKLLSHRFKQIKAEVKIEP